MGGQLGYIDFIQFHFIYKYLCAVIRTIYKCVKSVAIAEFDFLSF